MDNTMDLDEPESNQPMSFEALVRQLKEAERRAADEAKKRKEAEGRVADEAKKRKEAEGRVADEATKRRKTEESLKHAEESLKHAEESLKQKDESLKQKDESLKQKDESLKQKDEHLRQTTFEENLRLLHESTECIVVGDKATATTGGPTSVEGKFFPEKILPWKNCEKKLRVYYDKFRKVFHPPGREPEQVFPCRIHLEEKRNEMCAHPFSCEDDIRSHQRFAVEFPTEKIFSELISLAPQKAKDLGVGEGVHFPSHPNGLTEEGKNKPVDRLCVDVQYNGERTRAFIIEYKPPHKLSSNDLQGALKTPGLCRKVMSGDGDAGEEAAAKAITQTFDYMVELGLEYSYLTTAEAFVFLHIRWVKGKKNCLKKLFYHMVNPKEEVRDKKDVFYSAVGQAASFCLMSLKSGDMRKSWLDIVQQAREVKQEVEKRKGGFPIRLWDSFGARDLASESSGPSDSPPSSSYQPSSQESASQESASQESASQESSAATTNTHRLNLRPRPNVVEEEDSSNDDNDDDDDSDDDDDDESDDDGDKEEEEEWDEEDKDDGEEGKEGGDDDNGGDAAEGSSSEGMSGTAPPPKPASGPGPGAAGMGTEQLLPHRSGSGLSQSGRRYRRYCTQACLMGLKRGSPLDSKCPNVVAHRRAGDGVHHPITADNFPRLLVEQLAQSVYRHCKPLGLQGSRGALFKLTLTGYGYTFVAKGTVASYVPDLRREGRWYQKLSQLQGDAVPVYLGNIDLKLGYYLDLDVDIVHMLLMSWGGGSLAADVPDVPDLKAETERTLHEVLAAGMVHGDVRAPNMLWNAERRRVMLVDFDRATSVPRPKRVRELRRGRKARSRGLRHLPPRACTPA